MASDIPPPAVIQPPPEPPPLPTAAEVFADPMKYSGAVELLLLVEQARDPIEAFIAGLADEELKGECRKTVRMRKELEENFARALSASSWPEAQGYVVAVRESILETTCRWRVLLDTVRRWNAITPSIAWRVRVTP